MKWMYNDENADKYKNNIIILLKRILSEIIKFIVHVLFMIQILFDLYFLKGVIENYLTF